MRSAILSWAFGFATTIVLISTWGRAVVVDQATLLQAGAELAAADAIVRQVETIAAEALEDSFEVDDATAEGLVRETMQQTEGEQALRDLVAAVIDAGSAPPGTVRTVDLAVHLEPVVEQVIARLQEAGVEVDGGDVRGVLDSIDPIVVRSEEAPPVVGARSPTARTFTVAALLGSLVIIVSGAWLVLDADDRVRMARSLLSRLSVSALSFALLLQIASWLADPGGGRAPVRSALSSVLGAKVWLPLLAGMVAAAFSAVWWWLRRIRREAGSPPTS